MFHGMDVKEPQAMFRFLPLLSFTESYIYQVIICSTTFHGLLPLLETHLFYFIFIDTSWFDTKFCLKMTYFFVYAVG